MKKKTTKKQKRYVLATDSNRGIVAGYLEKFNAKTRECILSEARHCFYYSKVDDHEGIFGLITHGPGIGSKIGPAIPRHEMVAATISDICDDAKQKWLVAKWGK